MRPQRVERLTMPTRLRARQAACPLHELPSLAGGADRGRPSMRGSADRGARGRITHDDLVGENRIGRALEIT